MNYSTLKYPSNISNRCTINQKPPTSRASTGRVSKQIVPRVAVPFTGIDVTVSNRGPGKRVRTRRPLGSSIRKTRSLDRIWLRHAPIQANGHTDARLEVWQFLDAGFDPGERWANSRSVRDSPYFLDGTTFLTTSPRTVLRLLRNHSRSISLPNHIFFFQTSRYKATRMRIFLLSRNPVQGSSLIDRYSRIDEPSLNRNAYFSLFWGTALTGTVYI